MAFLDIKTGEKEKVFITWTMNVLLAVGHTIGWAAVHAMLVKRMGVQYLPYTYIAISILTILGSSLYLAFADTVRRDRLLLYFSIGTGACLVLARFFVTTHSQGETGFSWNLVLFFTLILGGYGLGYSTLGAQVWTMINDVFRPNQGRRLYPIIGTAHTLGGILGGLSISTLSVRLGTANLVLVWAASLFLLLPLVAIFQKRYGGELRGIKGPSKNTPKESRIENMKQGFAFILSSPLMKLLSGIALLFWVVGSFQDFQYTRIMNLTFATEERLSSFYGYYAMGFNITALVLHLLFTGRIIRVIGVGKSLCILPLVIVTGLCAILFRFTFIPGLLMRYSWDIIGMTLQGNAYQLIFNAVPGSLRGRVRGFLEGVVNPLGGIFGGLVIIVIRFFFSGQNSKIFMADPVTLVGILLAVIWLVTAWTLNKKYIQAVIQNLTHKDRQTSLDAIESLAERGNKAAMEALLKILESGTREARISALRVLPEVGRLSALRTVSGIMTDPDEGLRAAAVKSVRHYPGIRKHPFLAYNFQRRMEEIMTHDDSAAVRGEAARYLMTSVPHKEVPRLIQTLLAHEDPVVRCKVIETAIDLGLDFTDFSIESALKDKSPHVRAAAALALWPVHERRQKTTAVLCSLMEGNTVEEKTAGFKTAVKLQSKVFLSQAERALDSAQPAVRIFGALVFLSVDQIGHPKWGTAVKILVSAISDPGQSHAMTKEIIASMSNLSEQGLDAVIIGLTLLPEAQRETASAAMKIFYAGFNRTIETDS